VDRSFGTSTKRSTNHTKHTKDGDAEKAEGSQRVSKKAEKQEDHRESGVPNSSESATESH